MPASIATFDAPLQRCILGTAQFGLAYGIANRSGQPDLDRMIAILSRAAALGVDTLDTAAAYGQAETRLGLLPADLAKAFRIITKASIGAAHAIGPADLARLRSSVQRSCDRLGRDLLDGLLLHDAAMLHRPGAERIGEALESLRQDKLVAAIGVSVYTAADITRALSLFTPDLIQAPANALDQRLFIDGAISALESRGVEIHLRSLFLQGLLLMAPEQLPPYLAPLAQIPLARVRDLAQRLGVTVLDVCLAFGLAHLGTGRMVLGVSRLEELDGIAQAMPVAIPVAKTLSQLDWSALAENTTDLLDPSRWPLLARKGGAVS